MKFIIAKKQEMTQIWEGDRVVAVTKLYAEPCQVTQIKSSEKDGYEAIQLGSGSRKLKNISKPQVGHLKKAGLKTDNKTSLHHLREFRGEGLTENISLGDVVSVDTFEKGDKIQVTGYSKGKGFQGVVKRHGFKGTDEQHGNKDQSRMPGSIGATGPAHVFKGTRMGGRTGGDRVTMKTLEIADVDAENNFIYIKGAVPGARNGIVLISGEGELKITKPEVKEEKKEEAKDEEKEEVKKEEAEAKEEKAESTKEEKQVEEKTETPEQVEKEVVEAKEKVEKEKVDNK